MAAGDKTLWIVFATCGGAALCVMGCCGGCLLIGALRQPSTRREVAREVRLEASAELQAERLKMIQDLQRAKVLQEIKGGRAYVLASWHGLTLDKKQAFAGVWVAWVYGIPRDAKLQAGEQLQIVDAYTGKHLGTVDRHGLHLE